MQLNQISQGEVGTGIVLILAAIWTTAWKGISLWRSSKNDQKYWFVALLVLNTLGLLEILYLLFFQKEDRYFKKIKSSLSEYFG